jgi:hypothetical protein
MLNKKIKITLFIVSVLTIIVAYGILMPPKVLTRENNKGNEYKQLDRLMNTTRYAEQVRKAGYEVDDYGLKMMDRIPKLETKGETKFEILSPTDLKNIHVYTYTSGYSIHIILDKNMKIRGGVIDQGDDKPYRELTEKEKSKYEKEIKQEINKLLDDVYKVGQE